MSRTSAPPPGLAGNLGGGLLGSLPTVSLPYPTHGADLFSTQQPFGFPLVDDSWKTGGLLLGETLGKDPFGLADPHGSLPNSLLPPLSSLLSSPLLSGPPLSSPLDLSSPLLPSSLLSPPPLSSPLPSVEGRTAEDPWAVALHFPAPHNGSPEYIDCPAACVACGCASCAAGTGDLQGVLQHLQSKEAEARAACARGPGCSFRHIRLTLNTALCMRQSNDVALSNMLPECEDSYWVRAAGSLVAHQFTSVCPKWGIGRRFTCNSSVCPFLHPHPWVVRNTDCSAFLESLTSGTPLQGDHTVGCPFRHSWTLQSTLVQQRPVRLCKEWGTSSTVPSHTRSLIMDLWTALCMRRKQNGVNVLKPAGGLLPSLDVDLVGPATTARLEAELHSALAGLCGCPRGVDCSGAHLLHGNKHVAACPGLLSFLTADDIAATLTMDAARLLVDIKPFARHLPVDKSLIAPTRAATQLTKAEAPSGQMALEALDSSLEDLLGPLEDEPDSTDRSMESSPAPRIPLAQPAALVSKAGTTNKVGSTTVTKPEVKAAPTKKPTLASTVVAAEKVVTAAPSKTDKPSVATSTCLPKALVPEGLGIDGTLSIGTNTNVILAASNILARRHGKGRCPDWFVMKKYCPRGDACHMFHLRLCPDDRPALGGGLCPRNKNGKCDFWHFRPVHQCRAYLVKREPRDCKYGHSCTYLHVNPATLNLPELSQEAPIPPLITSDSRRFVHTYGTDAHGLPLGDAGRGPAVVAATVPAPADKPKMTAPVPASAPKVIPLVASAPAPTAAKPVPLAKAPAPTKGVKPASLPATAKTSAKVASGAGATESFQWQCPMCTFAHNDILEDTCQICESRRP